MLINTAKFLIVLTLSFCNSIAGTLKDELFLTTSKNHTKLSYGQARTKLFSDIYLERDNYGYFIAGTYCLKKFYPFDGAHPNGRLPNSDIFNTEHTWPQSKFSRNFNKNLQKADLHHLFPTFSRINSERGNFPFAEVSKTRDLFCNESQIGNSSWENRGTYFEPPDNQKGNTARAMFYFSVRYKIAIDQVQESYLRKWHRDDPVDSVEKFRHEKIYRIQKNRNPFIDSPELVSEIIDF